MSPLEQVLGQRTYGFQDSGEDYLMPFTATRVLVGTAWLALSMLGALHGQHPPHHDSTRVPPPDTAHALITPLGISMDRLGSGTAWIPDAVAVPSRQFMRGRWEVMLHSFVFAQYDTQSGPRGDDQFGSLNWAMVMLTRNLSGGRFQARTMLSLDPATVTNRGYPLLVQSGETYQGQPLVDRQHPHDFWMELGVMYERAISSSLGVSVYVAPSGEPALGPVAFMHRPSAMDDLAAPLSHHWLDATHISFGVLTAGVFGAHWKLEGSWFNGREPDESRWGFDPIRLDSYSARFTVNPTDQLSFAAGYGFLQSPEALDPAESMRRVTVSALYSRKRGNHGQLAAALIWGGNIHDGELTGATVLEGEVILDRSNTMFGRAERVRKSAEDLVLPTGPGGVAPDSHFDVSALSLGFIRELGRTFGATIGLGVRGTINFVPASLSRFYGSTTPLGGFVFLRLRPYHRASAIDGMDMDR